MRRSPAGFTLLETLVTLSVLGLLLAGLGDALRTMVDTWHRQSAVVAHDDGLGASLSLLRELGARMRAPDPASRSPTLVGDAHRIRFVSTLPQAAGAMAGRPADISIALVGDEAQITWSQHYPAPTGPALDIERTALLRGVARLDFAYWTPGEGWRAEWRALSLPELIRIQIGFPSGSGRSAPELIVRPMRQALRS